MIYELTSLNSSDIYCTPRKRIHRYPVLNNFLDFSDIIIKPKIHYLNQKLCLSLYLVQFLEIRLKKIYFFVIIS